MPNIPCPGSAQCLPLQHPCPVQAPSCHCWRSACQVGFPLCHLHFARLHDGQTRMSRATARGQHCASPLNICAVFMQLNQVVVGKATRSTSPHLLRGQRLASLNNCTLEADLSPLASPFGVQSICLAIFPPSEAEEKAAKAKASKSIRCVALSTMYSLLCSSLFFLLCSSLFFSVLLSPSLFSVRALKALRP